MYERERKKYVGSTCVESSFMGLLLKWLLTIQQT